MSESYPQDQATWRTAPTTAGPSDTSPFQLPPEFYDPPQPSGGGSMPPDKRNKLLLQGLGLVGVAVLSGLIFWAVQPPHVVGVAEAQQDSQPAVAGKYTYSRVVGPAADADCAQHAYNATQQYLKQHPCKGLTRSLYSTTMPNGAQAIVSVAVVDMANPADADGLEVLTKKDGTGNVSDLITDGMTVPNGPSGQDMREGGFAASATGSRATIVLSAFVDGHQDKTTLKDISTDALRLTGK